VVGTILNKPLPLAEIPFTWDKTTILKTEKRFANFCWVRWIASLPSYGRSFDKCICMVGISNWVVFLLDVSLLHKVNCESEKVKVELSLYRPWRPLGLPEVEAPTFSDIRLADGGKVVSPTRRPLFTPRKIPATHFCYRLSRPQGHSAARRIR
jgi:hypothetical protein